MWSSKPFLRAKHLATTVQFSLYLNLLNLKLPPFPDTYGYRMLLTLIFYAKNVTLLIGTLFTMMTSTNGSNISQQQYSTSANVSFLTVKLQLNLTNQNGLQMKLNV